MLSPCLTWNPSSKHTLSMAWAYGSQLEDFSVACRRIAAPSTKNPIIGVSIHDSIG